MQNALVSHEKFPMRLTGNFVVCEARWCLPFFNFIETMDDFEVSFQLKSFAVQAIN
jgi:hypothetical protein